MFSNPLPPPGSRALLYGRFSDSHQSPLSATDQIDVLRADCERHGWSVVNVFLEEAKSGRSIKKRRAYLDMMAAAESGEADVICVFHLDRLGRNARELHHAKNLLKDSAAVIFTHDKGVMSRIEFALYAEMAQLESERIAERTTRGRRAAARRGKYMGSVPYGYKAVPTLDEAGQPILNQRGQQVRKIVKDEDTAKVVLRVNLDFDAGKSPHQIAIALNRENVPTPTNKRDWHPNTVIGVARSQSGLLRNPIYVGRVIHGKVVTEYDDRTGDVKRRKAPAADVIEHHDPDLRIVPQDVWDRNQERLSRKLPSKLRGRRRPSYLLSGLIKCGVCGRSYIQLAAKMGCQGAHLKDCDNTRRVHRQELEQAVLDGFIDRLAQPHVLEWFIPEYQRERVEAASAVKDRYDLAVRRQVELDREIENLMAQARAGAKGFAAQLLNDNLEALGAEKERLAREVRAGPARPQEIMTADFLASRLSALLGDLRGALEGDERDVARAREIIRSLITAVTITPLDFKDLRPDGRDKKGVRVIIDGEVGRLVDQSMLEKKIMHSRGAADVHDLPIASFRFYVDMRPTIPSDHQALWRDVEVVERLLDRADWPVTTAEMVAGLNDRGRATTATERQIDQERVRAVHRALNRGGWLRGLRLGRNDRGWVWAAIDRTDADWRVRYDERHRQRPTTSGTFEDFRNARVYPPEAFVVTVSSGSTATSLIDRRAA